MLAYVTIMNSMLPADWEPCSQSGSFERRASPGIGPGLSRIAATTATVVLATLVAPFVSFGQGEWPPDRHVLRTFHEEHWPTGQQFLGSRICQDCHPAVWENFPRDPHFKSVALANRPEGRTGCEGCHGPAGLHVIDPDNGKIVKFPEIEPSQAQDVCLRCHSEDIGKMHIRRSAHLTGGNRLHELPFDPQPPRGGCAACGRAAERLLRLPSGDRSALQHAVQAPCQRGGHGLLGLPQSTRSRARDLAHGALSAHGFARSRE